MKNKKLPAFTLIEIIVATTLFAFTSVALTTMFNYTLKINRKAEALRQASQATLDTVELIAKEVRNGQIDYDVLHGQTIEPQNSQCPMPSSLGASSYTVPDNRLGVVDVNGDRWCFYLGDASGSYVGPNNFNNGKTLVVVKNNGPQQIINPPNETMSSLSFFIQPICDPYTGTGTGGPYCTDYGTAAPKIQPSVTILANFTIKLPTGEIKSIPYQTTISTDKYDVPNSP